jgi:hypothetical protein
VNPGQIEQTMDERPDLVHFQSGAHHRFAYLIENQHSDSKR